MIAPHYYDHIMTRPTRQSTQAEHTKPPHKTSTHAKHTERSIEFDPHDGPKTTKGPHKSPSNPATSYHMGSSSGTRSPNVTMLPCTSPETSTCFNTARAIAE
eukprot:3661495-Amphidinium_carterae.2